MKINYSFLLGLLAVILIFSYIEIIHPYNFVKDDNLTQFLPFLLEGSNQLFQGSFPSINLHQFLGTRLFEVGTYSIFYPITIISYFLAHYIFHNDFLTLEIFVLIHLILGFAATYFFLASKTKNKEISCLAAIAFIFSGYVLIATADWYYVIPTIFFLPLILFLNDNLKRKNSWIYLGVIRGIYFYSGNAQYFAFAAIFELIYFLINNIKNKETFSKNFEKYIFSIIITLIISLPLLYSQFKLALSSSRGNNNFIEYFLTLPAMPHELILGNLFVYPLVKSNNFFSYSSPSFIEIYYSGTLFSIICFLAIIYFIFKYKKLKKTLKPFFWLSIISSLLSFGYFGLIYLFGAFIPIIKNFSNPFKITIFTNFFIVCLGAIILSEIISYVKEKEVKQRLIFALLSIILIFFSIFLIYHVFISTSISWSYHGDKLPLNLSEFDTLNLQNQRIVSVFTNSSFDPRLIKYSTSKSNFAQTRFLSQDFATYYNLDHLAGYDPFIDRLTEEKIPISIFGISSSLNLTTLQEYGVKYVFIPKDSLIFHQELSQSKKIYEKDNLIIIELENAKTYVFSEKTAINYTRLSNGFSFSTNYSDKINITINLLYKPEYVVKLNNKKTEIYQDNLGRMYIQVPGGENSIKVYYFPRNLVIGISLSILIFAVFVFFLIFKEKIYKIIKKIYKSFPKRKFSRKLIIILIIAFFILFIFLIKISLFSPSNISKIINSRTGISLDIDSIKTNLFLGKISLNQIKSKEKTDFYTGQIELKISYKESLKQSIKNKRLLVIFSQITLSNLSLNVQINQSKTCPQPMEIYADRNLLSNLTLEKDKIIISGARFIPFNKAYLKLNETDFIINNKTYTLGANLSIEKQVFGEIKFSSEKPERIQICITLPIEKKNLIYY